MDIKVGDKVRILSKTELQTKADVVGLSFNVYMDTTRGFVQEMEPFLGTIQTVKTVNDCNYGVRLNEVENWSWHEDWLEKIPEEDTTEYIGDPGVIKFSKSIPEHIVCKMPITPKIQNGDKVVGFDADLRVYGNKVGMFFVGKNPLDGTYVCSSAVSKFSSFKFILPMDKWAEMEEATKSVKTGYIRNYGKGEIDERVE